MTTRDSKVISFRFSTQESAKLEEKALEGESLNQTAQRLLREALGLSTERSTVVDIDQRIAAAVEPIREELKAELEELRAQLGEFAA
jgi:N-formylglutamate amidohydrolase